MLQNTELLAEGSTAVVNVLNILNVHQLQETKRCEYASAGDHTVI